MVPAGLMGSGPGALAGWLVPDAEQGSRRVRIILGEPGTALLSTREAGDATRGSPKRVPCSRQASGAQCSQWGGGKGREGRQ